MLGVSVEIVLNCHIGMFSKQLQTCTVLWKVRCLNRKKRLRLCALAKNNHHTSVLGNPLQRFSSTCYWSELCERTTLSWACLWEVRILLSILYIEKAKEKIGKMQSETIVDSNLPQRQTCWNVFTPWCYYFVWLINKFEVALVVAIPWPNKLLRFSNKSIPYHSF